MRHPSTTSASPGALTRAATRAGVAATAVGATLASVGALHAAINARLLRRPAIGSARALRLPSTIVLVPARDEGDRIAACLRSIAAQDTACDVLVLDDGSSDATAAIAASLGARVVSGAPLPAGWYGKAWACAQLAVGCGSSDVLVFVDADVRLAPDAVRHAVGMLVQNALDVVCPFPRQVAITPAERIVQPLLQWSWLTMLPLRAAERSSRPSLTSACGQFVVVRRDALDRIGGFAAIRGEVLDDLALVRAIKASGGRGGVVDGTRLATCRMYSEWSELRDGYGKSLWTAFGSPLGAGTVVAALALAYLVPAVAMLRGSRLGVLGYLAGVASRLVAARATGARAWPDALAHPVSVATFGYLALDSTWRHRRGELTWRGRPVGGRPHRHGSTR